MSWRPIGGFIFLVASFAWSPAARAQAAGSVQLYSQPNYSGVSFTISGRRNDVTLVWPVRSVRLGRGPGWRLCRRTQLRDCTEFTRNNPDVRIILRSAEQIAEPVPLPQPVPPGRPPIGSSLRGMASEYFPAPTDQRGRVISCASGGAACARESAQRFCRSRGWNFASFSLQETVNRQNFLADVLCTQSGN